MGSPVAIPVPGRAVSSSPAPRRRASGMEYSKINPCLSYTQDARGRLAAACSRSLERLLWQVLMYNGPHTGTAGTPCSGLPAMKP